MEELKAKEPFFEENTKIVTRLQHKETSIKVKG